MAYSFVQASPQSDTTLVGSHGAVSPGSPDPISTLPASTGTISLGSSMIASGIITMSPVPGDASGSATVTGLLTTDVVLTSISTNASGSTSRFFVNVNASSDTISTVGYALSGSTFATCHYAVFRSI